jgi:HEAT repeat protein
MTTEAALRDLAHADPRVRASAADALGRAPEADRDRALAALLRACDDAHPSVRYAALLSLGELAQAERAPDLKLAVAHAVARLDDGEPLVREAAAIALGDLGRAQGGPEAWDALVRAIRSSNPEVRFQAITSLSEIDPARSVEHARALLADPDGKVRAQAVAALGDSGDSATRDAIAAHLDDGDEIRWEAALALGRLDDRRGLALLVAGLSQRERAYDAASALTTLGAADDPAARAALERIVGRLFGDPIVKVRAAHALARTGHAAALAHLERAARSRREDVRGLATEALAELRR